MRLRVRKNLSGGQKNFDHIQGKALWEFVATVADWRCSLCFKKIGYADLQAFGGTRLCPVCSMAVNDDSGWTAQDETRQ